jgi:serine/threonine protein phosphatase PrpC
MACDGLWDKMTHQEAVDFVAERMTGGHSAQEISSLLANKALDLGSMDNVTVIVVFLKWKAPTP